jgi:hypothetical protein
VLVEVERTEVEKVDEKRQKKKKSANAEHTSPDPESNGDLLQSNLRLAQDRQLHSMCDRVVESLNSGLNLYCRGKLGGLNDG